MKPLLLTVIYSYPVGGRMQLHGYGSLFALTQLQQKLLDHTTHE